MRRRSGGDEAATPYRRQDGVAFGPGLQDLQADGALTGDDVNVVVRGDEDRGPQLFPASGLSLRLVVVAPGQLDGDRLGLEGTQQLELGGRNIATGEDRDRHAVPPSRVGHRDPVIARGDRDQGKAWFVAGRTSCREKRQLVVCGADLEGTGWLQRLELQPHFGGAGRGGQRWGGL